MALAFVITTVVLSAVCSQAVEHPRSRLSRSDRFTNIHVHVSVRPKYLEFGPNEIIAIRCRAKGGKALDDVPFITFYRKFGGAHMPLSSGDPGVLIRTQPANYGPSLFNKAVKTLYLGKESWVTMEYGDNLFFCRGANLQGVSQPAYFIVRKVWRHTDYWDEDMDSWTGLREV